MKTAMLTIAIILITWITNAQQKITQYYTSGKVKYIGFVKDNILDSTYVEYYENGNRKTEGTFKKINYKTSSTQIILGICGVGADTSKPSEGIKNGVWKSYYKNGKLSLSQNYFGNIRVGQVLSYDSTGRLDQNEFYNAGKLIQRQDYYSNGILESFLTRTFKYIKNNKEKSYSTTYIDAIHEYYETGELKCIKQLNNDGDLIGAYTEYWPNGFVKLSGEYSDDKKCGLFIEYYKNGNTKFEGIIKNNLPQEKQDYSNELGKIIKIETWKKGKLISTEIKTRQ